MADLSFEFIAFALTWYVVLLFSVSVHESAHGWAALQMGDDTAYRQGRITLNPLAHIDPIGTVLIPALQILWGGIPLLAWAKPTPVGAHNFRRLARGHIFVAGAGPVSNLIMAVLFTGVLFAAFRLDLAGEAYRGLFNLLAIGVVMNIGLAVFNLLPLPPLDGSWIASWALPRPIAEHYDRIVQPYGGIILLILVATRVLGYVTGPVVEYLTRFLFDLAR